MKQYTKDLGRVSLVPSGMWDIEKSYDRLSLVYHSGNKFAYIAKQDVPANTSIDNKEYWQPMNVTGYADNNFINLSTVTKDGTITVYDNIGEAIKSVASDIRKPGAVLSFYNTNEGSLDILPEYELWQFNSTDVNDWENPDYWNNIYFNKNVFVGWYINENILYKYQSTPSVGQYAYVGVDFYTSLLYQCRADGVWTNTNTTIGDFISIIVKGNVEVGPNGNWWNNGVDTGFPASVDSEVVIDKVVNNVLEQLKDGITTDKITTNTIEAEEIDEEKNLNIIADKIISDAEIVIGNSIINNNKITTDRLFINNKTADDILLGDGSTTSLSKIKESYLPLSGGDMNDGANINLSGTGALHFSNIDADNILNVDSSMIHLEHKENDENTVTEENTIDIGNKTITIYSKDNIEGNDGNTQITANGVTTNGTIKGQDINAVSTVKGALIIKEGGTDKQILMADGSVKIIDEVVGKYLPLAGGDMDESANISMTNGDITITNSNENSSVIHNGLQSTYVASNNNKTNTVDIDNTGIRLTENNSNSSENNSETFISATNITYTGTNYKTVINDEDGIEVRSLSNDYYSTIRNGQISICNNNGNSSTFDTSGLNISLHDDTLATLTDTELNLNDATVLNAEGLTLSAAKFTNSTLSLGNDTAHISTTDIELASGAATFNPGGITLGDGITRFGLDNGGILRFNDGQIKFSSTVYSSTVNGIYWDSKRYINISDGLYIHSGGIVINLNEGNTQVSNSGKIQINAPIGDLLYDRFLDISGNNIPYNNLQGLFFSSLNAFTAKGVCLHKDSSIDNYKNAILRNMPYSYGFTDWDDKLQYTIGPKDTSFDTEYDAVAPLVQDTTDPSKWTIPSEYLPDTSTNKDSVELYIPKYIESVKGQQIDLYFDNVSSEFNEYNSYPTQVRTLGSNSTLVKIEKNHYRCDPFQSDVFFVEKYDNTSEHNILLTKTFNNIVVTNNPTGLTKNICIMGDGFISETYMMAEIKKLFDNAALGTINLIGTKSTTLDGTTYTHEGRKDWDWTHYLDTSYGTKPYSGSTNAFVVDNEINFQKYMSTYFSELTQNIDYFVICMSTKEVMYGVSDDIIASVIENTKQFVDILLSSDKGFPECKIAILLQPVGPYNSNNGNINIDIYQSSINKLNKALIEAFDAGNYNTHVTTSGANLFINRYDGYDYKDITVDEYSSRTVRQYKNLPYLSEIGARQYGKGIYNKLRSFIDGNL